MLRRVAFGIALVCVGLRVWADTSLVLGKAVSQFDDVGIQPTPEETCPPNSICLWSWSRWTLDVQQTILGPAVPNGRAYVVRMQHAPVTDSTFNRPLLFVLDPVADPAERKRLHADYVLRDIARPEAMICTTTDPESLGVSPSDIYRQDDAEGTSFCFTDPRAAED